MIRVKLNDAIQVNVDTADPEVAAAEARRYFRANHPQEFEAWRRTQLGLGSSFTRGLSAGIDQFQSTLFSAAEGLGRATGDRNLEEYGRAGRIEQQREAEAAFPTELRQPFTEVTGLGSAGRATAEAVAGSLPSSAATLGGALAGARAARGAGFRGRVAGAVAGGTAAAFPQLFGANIERQIEESGDITSPGAAAGAAAIQAPLESAADVATLGAARLIRRPATEAAQAVGEGLFRRIGRGAAVGAATETPVEVTQTALERGQAGLPVFTPEAEARREYLEAALGGAAAGAFTGGAIGGVFGQRPTPAPTPTPAPEPAPEAAAEAGAVPTGPEPIEIPERPVAFSTPEEAQAFLDEQASLPEEARVTLPAGITDPEAVTGFVNSARIADWQRSVQEARGRAISEFLPTAPETNQPILSDSLTNLLVAANRGDINLNNFTPNAIAKAALGSRNIDPGNPSQAEIRDVTTRLNALADAGVIRQNTTEATNKKGKKVVRRAASYSFNYGAPAATQPAPEAAPTPPPPPPPASPRAPEGPPVPQAPPAPPPPQGSSSWMAANAQAALDLAQRAPAVTQRIRDLHNQGKVAKEIADELGLDVNDVRVIRDSLGLQPLGPSTFGVAGPAIPGGTPSAPQAGQFTFKTARGSTYTGFEDGTTTRDKAARPEHPGDSGPKPRSTRTIYVTPDVAQRMAVPADVNWRFVITGDNTFSLITQRPDGQWGVSPSQRDLPFQTQPAVGLNPFEFWRPETVNGLEGYRSFHPGNQITEISRAAPAPAAPAPAAPAQPTARTTVEVDGVRRETTPETLQQTVDEMRAAPRPAQTVPTTAATPAPRNPLTQPAPQAAPAGPPRSAATITEGGPELKTAAQAQTRLQRQYDDSLGNPIFKYFASPIMTMGKVKPLFQAAADAMKRFYTRSQEATTEFGGLLEKAAKLPVESRARIALAMQESRSKQQPIDATQFSAEENAAIQDLLKAGQRAYDYMIEAYVRKFYDPANAKTDADRARLQAFQRRVGDRNLLEMSPAELQAASPEGYRQIQSYNRMRDPYYFPQIGIGTHFVAAYKRKPGGTEDIVRLYAFTPLNTAQKTRGFRDPEAAAIRRLQEEFPDSRQFRIMTRGMQFENNKRAQDVRRNGDFIAQYLQELSAVSGREAKQVIGRMSKEIDKAQMAAIFRPNKDILRAVTPDNAAEYILDVLPNYYLSVAKIQARRYVQDDLARAIAPLTPNDRAFWNDLFDYSSTPTEAYGTARALAFFMYLGAAPDTALINLSQLPFVTYPRLVRDGGAGATGEFLGALKTVMFNRDFGKLLKGELAFTNEVIAKTLNKDEADALIQARKQGIFTPLFTNESRGQVTADSLRRFGIADQKAAGAARGINKLTDLFGRFMQAAEETNRLSTFLAAYRLAKKNPGVIARSNHVDNTNYQTPYDYAANVVFDTQFITSKEDRALIQRFVPEAEVATQFMSFPLKMIEQYVRHADMVVRGFKNQDPVLAKAGAVALMGMIAPLVAVAGIWALPFADSLREITERLIKFIWGNPTNFKVEIERMLDGNDLSRIINYGAPHVYGYASLQRRLAIDPLPAEDLLSASTLSLFGPVGGLIEKVPQSIQYYQNGDYWGLAATVLPRAMGNVVKGLQFEVAEEQFTRRGTRIITERDLRAINEESRVPASVRQALGFPPPQLVDLRERVARREELQTQMRGATERANMELSRILLRGLQAREAGDTAEAARQFARYVERRNEILLEQEGKPMAERIILDETAIRRRTLNDLQGRASPESLLRETRRPARQELIEDLQRQGVLPRP